MSYKKSQLAKQHDSQHDCYVAKLTAAHWPGYEHEDYHAPVNLPSWLENLSVCIARREVAGRGEDESADAGAGVEAAEALQHGH